MPHVKEHLGEDAAITQMSQWKLVSKMDKIIKSCEISSYYKHTRICSNHFEYGQPREMHIKNTKLYVFFLLGHELI